MSGNEHLREEQVVPYLDRRLGLAERAAVDRHLEACTECRTRLAELRRVIDVLGEWQAVEPSPALAAAVRTRVKEEAQPQVSSWRWRWVYIGAVLAAAVVLLVVGVWSPTPSPPSGAGTEFTQTSEPTSQGVSDDFAMVEPVILEDYELLRDFDILFEAPANTDTTPEKRGT